jgi:lysine 2,3-aminomutase
VKLQKFALRENKQLMLHTHVNHQNEITPETNQAVKHLFQEGIPVRSQSVLIRGVNDQAEDLLKLVEKLVAANIFPYYIYMHDLVKGCENLRVPLHEALALEEQLYGSTAGYLLPKMVCDLPGGGGKVPIRAFQDYQKKSGISRWHSPLKKGSSHYYFDPIDTLGEDEQRKWNEISSNDLDVEDAIREFGEY